MLALPTTEPVCTCVPALGVCGGFCTLAAEADSGARWEKTELAHRKSKFATAKQEIVRRAVDFRQKIIAMTLPDRAGPILVTAGKAFRRSFSMKRLAVLWLRHPGAAHRYT